MRLLNVLKTFSEFNFADLDMDSQSFEDYKSAYLDLYDRSRSKEEAASILEEVDFELELIHRDEINVAYILKLLADLKAREESGNPEERAQAQEQRKAILDMLGKETQLRSKRELIERFINEYLPEIESDQHVGESFAIYWDVEKKQAVKQLCGTEGLNEEAVSQMIDNYHFTGKEPLRDTVFDALENKPKLLERKSIFDRVVVALLDIVRKFDDGLGDL